MNQTTLIPLMTVPKVKPKLRRKPHQTQYRAVRTKSKNENFLRAANVEVAFPSRSGIAFFAKVGLNGDFLT
jgi:hypothetical protein